MELTLRKASALSKSLLETARKLPLERTVEVSVHTEGGAPAAVKPAEERLNANLADARALTTAAFELRGLIGEANREAGIDRLLTEKANLDAQERLVSSVANVDGTYNAATDLSLATPRLAQIKERLARPDNYHDVDTLRVRVPISPLLADDLLAISRRKTKIADELLDLNTTTKVSVPASVADLLTRFKLV